VSLPEIEALHGGPPVTTGAGVGFRRAFARALRNPTTALGAGMILLLILAAIFGPLVAPYGAYHTDPNAVLLPPSRQHLFGTGSFGEDIFSRVLFGARFDLAIGFGTVLIGLVAGCAIGAVAGFWEGIVGEVLMRLMDLLLAFPQFILAMAISAALGGSLVNLIIAIALTNVPIYAHLMRVKILSLKDTQFAMAAVATGNPRVRVLYRHLLPNTWEPILVQATLQPGWAILSAAGLSFIGLGVHVPDPEWGVMVSMGSQYIITGQWWPSFFPGLLIVAAVMGFNLLGDGLEEALSPERH
jgi:peptide/nickel transport system permease protein